MSISKQSLSGHDSKVHNILLENIRDIERIGDHIENLIELTEFIENNGAQLSEDAMQELNDMLELVVETVSLAIQSLDQLDVKVAKQVLANEDKIDHMERKLRKHHIVRLNNGICTGSAGVIFVDIISNLERVGDHAANIAESVIEVK